MSGILCVSLDTEFFWGVHDTASAEYRENIRIAREQSIPKMLQLFEKYNIHVTWAMVGAAFAEKKNELLHFLPDKEYWPSYSNMNRSPYRFLEHMEEDEKRPSVFLAGKELKRIQSYPHQEIGTHTFSHYYCNEAGQTPEQFMADMNAAINIAKTKNIILKSHVFPKGEYSEAYQRVCAEVGIKVYRGLEENWVYDSNMPLIIKKILRFSDAYFPITGHNCHFLKEDFGLLNIIGSRIFKPYNKKLRWLEPLKIRRIKSQMKYAATHNAIFHLWWHPHNFGNNVEENLKNLENVLKYFGILEKKYRMKSMNMGEIYDAHIEGEI